MVPHYSASGWLAPGQDDEGLIDLVARGAMEGIVEVLQDGTEYRVLADRDRDFELWLYAAHGQVRGAVPFVRGPVRWQVVLDQLLPRVTGGMGAVVLHPAQEEDLALCVEVPDFPRFTEDDLGTRIDLDICGLAYMARTIPTAEESLCRARLYPYGLLNDAAVVAGEGSRCDVLLCGRIVRVDERINGATSLPVLVLELEIEGLRLAVAVPPRSIEGDRPEPGRLLEGVFWLVGRVPQARSSGAISRAFQRIRGR